MQQGRRIKQIESLEQRLTGDAMRLREKARSLSHGPERERLLRRARQAETASRINAWLESAGLRPPA